MYYTNTMKITLKDNATANKALKILRNRLVKGFTGDSCYRGNPSQLLSDALEIADNTIVLPDEFGSYLPTDAANVIAELMQDLAMRLCTEAFTFRTCNSSDYDEGWVDGSYMNGELKVKDTYLPSGFGDYYCNECDNLIATMKDDAEGNLIIQYKEGACSECGEEINWSEWLPVITEKSIQIF